MASANDPNAAMTNNFAQIFKMFINMFKKNAGMDRIDLSIQEGQDFHQRLTRTSEAQHKMAGEAFEKGDNLQGAVLEWRSEVLKELAEPFQDDNLENLAEKPQLLDSKKISENMVSKLETKLQEAGFEDGIKGIANLKASIPALKTDPKDLLNFDKELINKEFDMTKSHHRQVIQGLNRATETLSHEIKKNSSPAEENGHDKTVTYPNGQTHEQKKSALENKQKLEQGQKQKPKTPEQDGPSGP